MIKFQINEAGSSEGLVIPTGFTIDFRMIIFYKDAEGVIQSEMQADTANGDYIVKNDDVPSRLILPLTLTDLNNVYGDIKNFLDTVYNPANVIQIEE